MDTGKGTFAEVHEEVYENLSAVAADGEKYRRLVPSLFKVGEILSIQLSKFRIVEIKEDGHMLLKLVAR